MRPSRASVVVLVFLVFIVAVFGVRQIDVAVIEMAVVVEMTGLVVVVVDVGTGCAPDQTCCGGRALDAG